MHSFLIVSKNKKSALDFTKSECEKNQIDKFDIDLLIFEKAIGIEDVRNLQKKIMLKPLKSKTKAIILDAYNGITIPAQNALLKILEEPPLNTIIYITSSNKELFLPTIISRCKIIEIKDDSYKLSDEENSQYLNLLISLFDKSIGEKLKLAQDISKNKDDAAPWLEKMIIVAREKLISFICHSERQRGIPLGSLVPSDDGTRDDNVSIEQYLNILISLNKTYTILKTTNVNPRLALENLFLNI